MSPVGGYPRKSLGHLVSAVHVGSVTRRTFRMSPLPFHRPDQGTRDHDVACGECGTTFSVRVSSARDTARTKWLGLGVAACGALVLAAAVHVFVTVSTPPDDGPFAAPVWAQLLSSLAAAVGFLTIIGGIVQSWQADGVRLLTTGGQDHQLLYPKRRKSR